MEADETVHLYSQKGSRSLGGRKPRKSGGSAKFRGISREQICIAVVRDRANGTLAEVMGRGPMTKAWASKLLEPYLGSLATLYSDYRRFSTEKGVEHVALNSQKQERVKRGIYHIQNVNFFHGRFKGWLDSFQGVATKCLAKYLSWFRFLDRHKD